MAGNAAGIRAGKAYYELGIEDAPLTQGLKRNESRMSESMKRMKDRGLKNAQKELDAEDRLRKKDLKKNGSGGLGAALGKGLASGMSKVGETLKNALTSPLAAIAAALAPVVAAKVFANLGRELTDISRRTGASTSALQTLGYAAKRTGSDLGAVEGALTTLRDKTIEAARGSEDAQAAFWRLGLNFLELSRMKPEDRLRKVAEALNRIENPAVRAAMATELLGSADMLPTLKALSQMEARAKRLGLVLGGDVVAAGKQLDSAMEDLHSNLMATVSVIGAKLSPAVSQIIEKWIEMSAHTRAWIADNTAMFSSAEALWAFLKLQWAKGSQYILEQFGLANRGMQSLWIDTQAALESGWERFKHAADHSFGWVADVATNAFKQIAEIGMQTAEALSTLFAYVSDDMAKAMQKAANMMARLMKKFSLKDAGDALKELTKKVLDQDNPELQKKLAEIEAARKKAQDALPGQGKEDAQKEVARLQAEYDAAKERAAANAPKAPGEGPNAGGPGGAGGNHQAGLNTALMHTQGVGAVDVKSREGFASVAASLRQQQFLQQQYDLQQRQFNVQRDILGRITKITVVGRK